MSIWFRHVHMRPHCFILTEECSCRLELAYFARKISKNRLVCKTEVALAYYGSCRLLVIGSWYTACDMPGMLSSTERMQQVLTRESCSCATTITSIDQLVTNYCDCVEIGAYKILLSISIERCNLAGRIRLLQLATTVNKVLFFNRWSNKIVTSDMTTCKT